MPDPVVISIDAMGGDHGPPVTVAGAALAVERLKDRPVRFLLHGDAARIDAEVARQPALRGLCEVRHTDRVIAADEKAATALRRGKGSSIWNAIEALREQAAAAVSAGNTGAVMAIAKLQLRMVGGVERPAAVASWPTLRGTIAVLDVGANIASDAAQLIEFAIMGEAFHCAVHGAPGHRSTVGLLNVGSEEQKGNDAVREAHRLLRSHDLGFDYHGFVEGNDIALGTVDVVVTDGFTGNAVLKTGEGMARFFAATLRETLTSTPMAKAGALMASGALNKMKARLDPSSVNGGPLLGLNGTVVKSHGGADPKGFANAVKMAADLAASDYARRIERNMERLSAVMDAQAPAEAAS